MISKSGIVEQERESHSLIIISGLPRSGTSWLGKLLDSHPQTLYRHEPDSMEYPRSLPLVIEKDYNKYKSFLLNFISSMPNITDPKVSASMPVFKKDFLRLDQRLIIKNTLSLVKLLSYFNMNINIPLYCIPKKTLEYTLVWKTIESSGRLKFYDDVLVRKRIIYILRHPCAIIASQLRGKRTNKLYGYTPEEDFDVFRMLLESSEGARSGLTLKNIIEMHPVERLAWQYIITMEKAVNQMKESPDCKILVYEDLCEKPIELIQELFEFCSLSFDKQSSDFLHESISKNKKGYYSIWRDPLESAHKWKKELSSNDKAIGLKLLEKSFINGFWHH